MIACSFLHMMHPTLDPSLWTLDEILNGLLCNSCNIEVRNWWHVCRRRGSAINLHPEYLSRCRQGFYIVIQTIKFLPIPKDYYGPIYKFRGPHVPQVIDNPRNGLGVPKYLQPKKMIRYGKIVYLLNLIL